MVLSEIQEYTNHFYFFEKLLLLGLFISILTGTIARWFPLSEALIYLFLYISYMPFRIVLGSTSIPLLISFPVGQTTGILANCSVCTSYSIFIMSWEFLIITITFYPPARSKFQERVAYYIHVCRIAYIVRTIQRIGCRWPLYIHDLVLFVVFADYIRPLGSIVILIMYFTYMAIQSIHTPTVDMRDAYSLPQIDESRRPILRTLEMRLARTVG